MSGVVIRDMSAADASAVLAIYQEGIEGGDATFEVKAPDWATWDAGKVAAPRLVAERAGAVVGWAALSAASRRSVYRGVAEESVYVASSAQGQGVGRLLLDALVTASEAAGFWTLVAGVFPENEASLRLHRACGFEDVGVRRRIGLARIGPYAGRWRDVVWLERRSAAVGV